MNLPSLWTRRWLLNIIAATRYSTDGIDGPDRDGGPKEATSVSVKCVHQLNLDGFRCAQRAFARWHTGSRLRYVSHILCLTVLLHNTTRLGLRDPPTGEAMGHLA